MKTVNRYKSILPINKHEWQLKKEVLIIFADTQFSTIFAFLYRKKTSNFQWLIHLVKIQSINKQKQSMSSELLKLKWKSRIQFIYLCAYTHAEIKLSKELIRFITLFVNFGQIYYMICKLCSFSLNCREKEKRLLYPKRKFTFCSGHI